MYYGTTLSYINEAEVAKNRVSIMIGPLLFRLPAPLRLGEDLVLQNAVEVLGYLRKVPERLIQP